MIVPHIVTAGHHERRCALLCQDLPYLSAQTFLSLYHVGGVFTQTSRTTEARRSFHAPFRVKVSAPVIFLIIRMTYRHSTTQKLSRYVRARVMKENPKILQKTEKPEPKRVNESRRLRVGDQEVLGANHVTFELRRCVWRLLIVAQSSPVPLVIEPYTQPAHLYTGQLFRLLDSFNTL